MLLMFGKKRLMNYPKDCSLAVFLFVSPIIKKHFSLCQPDFMIAGFQFFMISGLRDFMNSCFPPFMKRSFHEFKK